MTVSTKPLEKRQTEQVSVKRGQPWYSLAAKIIAWQLVAIFIVELSLSIAGLGEEEIFKLDPVLGFKHMSNKKVTWRSEGFATSYFNEDGLRESLVTVAKPAGTFRVAILGDSLAESLQVPLEDSFGYRVQETLRGSVSRRVQVLDFGCSGYSTVQEYLQLRQQVLKYKPDLVLVCYNNRDCFENWSPPDEVLTNVRPAALHLPGRKLVVDSQPVAQWMKTPRARFLQRVDFLRQNSRLWGLFSAAELDWSLHNDTYKNILFFVTKPGKAIRKGMAELNTRWKDYLSKLKTTPATPAAATPAAATPAAATPAAATPAAATPAAATPTAAPSSTETSAVAGKTTAPSSTVGATPCVAQPEKPATSIKVNTTESVTTKAEAGEPPALQEKQPFRSTYEKLIVRTLGSLLAEMKQESNAAGAQFAVVTLPVRAALSVRKGMETAFNDFSFNDEVTMLKGVCKEKSIDFYNVHDQAKSLSAQDKDYLFYLVHLTPKGHEFVAEQLTPVVKDYVERTSQK